MSDCWNPVEELTYSQEGLDTISQPLRNKINEEYKDLERQLAEARDILLQVQDHMHQLSSHTSDGWAGASADNVFNMIEDKLEEIG